MFLFPLKDNLHYLSETSVWDQQTWSRESDLRISRFQKRSNLTKTIDVALDAYHREIKTKSTGPKKRGGINFLSLDPLTTAKLDENFSNYNDEELPLKLSEIMIKRMFPLDQLLAKVDNWIYVTTETKEKNRGKVSKRLENVLKLKKIIDNEKKGLDYISNAIDEEIKKRKKAKEESQLSFLDQKIQEYLEAYKKAVDIKLGAVQPAPPELPPRPEPVLDMANIAFLGSTNILSKKDWVSLSSRGISFMQRRSLYTKNIDAAVDQFHSVDLKNINESLEKAPSLNREKVLFYRQLIDRQITAVNKVFEKVDFWITYSKKSSKRSGKRSRRLKNIEEFMSNVMAEKNALDSHKKTFEKSLN